MKHASVHNNEIPSRVLPQRLGQPFEALLRTFLQQTASAAAFIALYDEANGSFTPALHQGDVDTTLLPVLCAAHGPAATVVSDRQPLLISARYEHDAGAAALAGRGLRCALFMPLCGGSQCFGVICALHAAQEDYTNSQRVSFSALAELVTTVLDTVFDRALPRPPDPSASGTELRPDFLASISQEIRAPLNGLLGMLNLLKQTRLTLEQQEYVDMSQSSGNDLLGLLNDILDISRIETGKLELERIDFDLRHSVEDLVDTFTSRAQQKRLELASIIFASVPQMVRGDPARLRQVLANLLGNAINHSETGEIVVATFPVEEDESGVLIGFEVRDSGADLTREQQLQMFSACVVDDEDSGQAGRTRLGLVISRELAEHMGGDIGVESEPGKGCTFWFTARFDYCETRPERPSAPVDLSSVRALVVDDHPTSCAVVEQMFLSWGMRYEGIADGASALRALDQASRDGRAYDLLIMETALRDMSGIELVKRIDAEIAAPCRKIMLTSQGQRGDALSARQAGLQAYLSRPVRSAQLRDVIERVMGLKERDRDVLITRFSLNQAGPGWQYRILIVEDDLISQKVALTMLKKLGLRADIAGNGVDAVSAVRRHRYDIVLMDIQMPEMNGYEATAAIRELEQATSSGQHIPVIALTGNALKGDRERCLEAGMDDYIAKPVIIEQLKDVLAQWLPADARSLSRPSIPVDPQLHPALNADPLDRPTFENLRLALGPEFSNVVGIYLDDARRRLADMQAAIETGDDRGLNRAAHTLKSASRYLGILPLADLCYTVEKAADRGDIAMVAPMVSLISQVFARAETALRESMAKALPV